ncbi:MULTISPECIES: serine/threonine protein kinase [unclassified Mycolicibacterium]|uniref:serine/threonine protein kinase n=1 Tax=unclassified Mycolicibacterium TaxID=2636767 RepID=UPI002ED9B4CE
MTIDPTKPLVLPVDVHLVRVVSLAAEGRAQFSAELDDYIITRARSRFPSKVISKDFALLLKEFRECTTIARAIASYSRKQSANPTATLESAYPMLRNFIRSGLLVNSDSGGATPGVAHLRPGDRFRGLIITDEVQLFEDTQVYRARNELSEVVALKRSSTKPTAGQHELFHTEISALNEFGGSLSPKLIDHGLHDGCLYLVIEWVSGRTAEVAAAELRQRGRWAALMSMGARIISSYEQLHQRGLLHGDIHPRNILIDNADRIWLIDFAHARWKLGQDAQLPSGRAGVGTFVEPEYAMAWLRSESLPPPTPASEQYSLGAVLFKIITGTHYLPLAGEADLMMHQIANQPPNLDSLQLRDPTLVPVLRRALEKDPRDRFPDLSAFRRAVESIDHNTAVSVAASGRPVDKHAAHRDGASCANELIEFYADLGPDDLPEPRWSVTLGSAGVAYFLYRTALASDDSKALALADVWSTRTIARARSESSFYAPSLGITASTVGVSSFFHGPPGLWAVHALVMQALGDLASFQSAVENFMSSISASVDNLDFIRGRPGILSAASTLLPMVRQDLAVSVQRDFTACGSRLLNDIWTEVDTLAAVGSPSKLFAYGIAHGWSGVLYATLRWCEASGATLPVTLRARLEQLADCAEVTGDGTYWEWRRTRDQIDCGLVTPGWCNGSAGLAFLWTAAARAVGRPEYLKLATEAASACRPHDSGLHDLCCGTVGQAYACLNVYRETMDLLWLDKCKRLAAVAVNGQSGPTSSLYKGSLGLNCLLLDLDTPKSSRMPLFEDEGWLTDHL